MKFLLFLFSTLPVLAQNYASYSKYPVARASFLRHQFNPSKNAFGDASLKAYLPLNEGLGRTAFDDSGSGNNSSWNGASPAYAPGKASPFSGKFDGSTNWLTVPNIPYENVLSIVAWIKTPATWPTTGGGSYIVSNRNYANWALSANNGPTSYLQWQAWGAGSASIFQLISSSSLTPNTWYFVAATTDGGTASVYINGTASGSMSYTGAIPNNGGMPIAVGRCSSSGLCPMESLRYFQGSIGGVRVYSRALSQPEILAIYNAENR